MLKKFSSVVLGAAICASIVATPSFGASASAVRYYNRGIDAYAQGDTAKALEFFERAVERDPQYADAHYNLGSLYYQLNNFQRAREEFAKTLELSPGDFQAKYNLGLALEKLSLYDEAAKYFSQIPPNNEKYQSAREKLDQIKPYLKTTPSNLSTMGASLQQQTHPSASAGPVKVDTFAKGFFGPTGMTIGPGGFMYVANYSKNAIYKVGADGEKVLFAQGDNLQGPIGLTFDPQTGELYVANYLKNNVARVDAKGDVSVLATGLKKPYNLFLDATNHILYVSEQETNTISRIQLR